MFQGSDKDIGKRKDNADRDEKSRKVLVLSFDVTVLKTSLLFSLMPAK